MIQKVGIDPDIHSSGVALIGTNLVLANYDLFTLLDMLRIWDTAAKKQGDRLVVHIEASHLISMNYSNNKSIPLPAQLKMANYVGQNHAIGILLVKFCQKSGIEYVEQKPLRRVWGKDRKSKISHDEFVKLFKVTKLMPELPKRTNQEQRDAALLIL